MNIDPKFLGQHIQTLRKARGMTQRVLAERSDLPAETIRDIEQGCFLLDLTTLEKLCKGFDLEVPAFLEALEDESED